MKKRIVLNAIFILVHISLIISLFFFDCCLVAIFVSVPIVVAIPAWSLLLEVIFFKKFKKHLLISRLRWGNVNIHLSSEVTIDKYTEVLQELDALIEQETSVRNRGTKKIKMRAWLIKGKICSHLESKGFKKSTDISKRLNQFINIVIGVVQLIFLWYTMLWRLPLTGVAKYQVDHGMVRMFKKYLHAIRDSWVKEIPL